MLGKGFFITESHNPVLPPEEWSEVYTKTTAGSYSESLSWGKYKIVISGAGGSGAACAYESSGGTHYAEDGTNGEEKTLYVNVTVNNSLTVSGLIGAGGVAAKAKANNGSVSTSGGTGGIGYQNGGDGTSYTNSNFMEHCCALKGGGGGGSTSIEWSGVVQSVLAGGNGGTARGKQTWGPQGSYDGWGYGGTGGNGGISGTGAAGGAGSIVKDGTATSTAGTDGYIHIYKSNLKPEPL